MYVFTAALALNDISITAVGEKFLFAVPTDQTNELAALLARKMPSHASAENTPLPAHAVQLRQASLGQVAALYQDLCGQAVEVDTNRRRRHFELTSQTPLAPAEALQALDHLLGWAGFSVIPHAGGSGYGIISE